MRKQALFLLIFVFCIIDLFSQSSSLKGTIVDSIEKRNVANSVIALLRKSDSTLARFTRADANGHFTLNNLADGKFIIMVTHPFLGDYFDSVSVAPAAVVDLGKIFMTPKSKLLAEVILKSGAPIRIKGDTTVYTADSFKVREGANVEELLRRLPGIQVDKNGQITAMGEKVKKVLVDGEEFFGSDPGIATKNLRADIVKEVEVFDKKSDQAEFTGIDDGVKDKTINLKLKDDKKRGYFGKVEAGGGLDDKYNSDIMLNAFKGKRKLAGYGIVSNTGQTNLDWRDAQNYGGGIEGLQTDVSDDGISMNFSQSDEDNYWGGKNGIPTNYNAGLHYSNKYNDNKLSLNSGYKFAKINSPADNRTFSKTFLPDTSWSTNTRSNNYSSVVKHAFNLTIESTLDSMNSLKWTTQVNTRDNKTRSNFYSESFTDAGDSINTSNRNTTNETDNKAVTSNLLWRHKFKKISRTLAINADLTWNRSQSDGLLNSRNRYYLDGAFDHTDTIDQRNMTDNEGKGLSTKVTYTEPLRKDLYLELSYMLSYNSNSNDRKTTIKDFNGKYEDIVDSLSNSFTFNRLVNTPGLSFRLKKKKINFTLGSSVGFSQFTQKNRTADDITHYHYTNFFPRSTFSYKPKPSENLRFDYNGSTNAPGLEQLQPTRVNTDPLNIYIGNQDLRQSFRHNFNIGYNTYNVLKDKNIWTNLGVTITDHAFSQSSSIDSLGRRIYQTINVDGVYSIEFFSDYGFKIKDTKWRLGFSPNMNLNSNIDYVNGARNRTTTNSYGMRLNISQYVPDKYNFYIGPNFTWNHSKASVNSLADVDYWQIEGWANASWTLPHSFELNSELNLQIRQKDPRFPTDNNYTTWNAFVIKRFSKNKYEVKLGVNDILNENKGYQRNFNSYSFTESYYTTLKRFWLLTFTWNITKNGQPTKMF